MRQCPTCTHALAPTDLDLFWSQLSFLWIKTIFFKESLFSQLLSGKLNVITLRLASRMMLVRRSVYPSGFCYFVRKSSSRQSLPWDQVAYLNS